MERTVPTGSFGTVTDITDRIIKELEYLQRCQDQQRWTVTAKINGPSFLKQWLTNENNQFRGSRLVIHHDQPEQPVILQRDNDNVLMLVKAAAGGDSEICHRLLGVKNDGEPAGQRLINNPLANWISGCRQQLILMFGREDPMAQYQTDITVTVTLINGAGSVILINVAWLDW